MSGWKSCRFIFPLDDLGTRTIKESLPNFSVKKSTISCASPYLMVCSTIALVFTSILSIIIKKQGKITKKQAFSENFRGKICKIQIKVVTLHPQISNGPFVYRLGREIFIL